MGMLAHKMMPIMSGTQAPPGILFTAAPQNKATPGIVSPINRHGLKMISPSKKPNTRKNATPKSAGKPLTYLNCSAMRNVVVSMTVATANLKRCG